MRSVCVCVCVVNASFHTLCQVTQDKMTSLFFFFKKNLLCERSVGSITGLNWSLGQGPGVCNNFAQGRDLPVQITSTCPPWRDQDTHKYESERSFRHVTTHTDYLDALQVLHPSLPILENLAV